MRESCSTLADILTILRFQSQYLSSGRDGDGEWVLPLTYCVGSYDNKLSALVRQKASVLSVPKVSSGDKTTEFISHGVYEVKRAEESMPSNTESDGDKTPQKNNSSRFYGFVQGLVQTERGSNWVLSCEVRRATGFTPPFGDICWFLGGY